MAKIVYFADSDRFPEVVQVYVTNDPNEDGVVKVFSVTDPHDGCIDFVAFDTKNQWDSSIPRVFVTSDPNES